MSNDQGRRHDPLPGLAAFLHWLFLAGPPFFHIVGQHKLAVVAWIALVLSGLGLSAWDRGHPVIATLLYCLAFNISAIGYGWMMGRDSGVGIAVLGPIIVILIMLEGTRAWWKTGLLVHQAGLMVVAAFMPTTPALEPPPSDELLLFMRAMSALSASGVLFVAVISALQRAQRWSDETALANTRLGALLEHHQGTEDKLRTAVAEADLAAEARAEFFGSVRHELRTPLSVVLGLTEAMQEEARGSGDTELRADLDVLMTGARRLHQAVEDLLDMATVELVAQTARRQPFDCADLLADIEASLAPMARASGIRLVTSGALGEVVLDRGRVRRALDEVLESACRQATGVAQLSATRDPEAPEVVVFVVSHDGPVTPAAEQSGGATELYLAGRLVDQMGGRLLSEKLPDGASRIRIILPEGTRHPVRVLVVDDMRVNGEVLVARLGELNANASWVSSGAEALELLGAGRRVDLVLLDLQMPHMDGFETAERINGLTLSAPPRIVAITADDTDSTWQRCMEAGFEARLLKPPEDSELLGVLGREARADETDPDTGRLDRNVLRELSTELDDPAFIGELVQWFALSARDQISTGRRAAEQGDPETMERAAHSLKGAAASVGATRLHLLARDLEALSASGELETTLPRWALVEEEVGAVSELLGALQ